MRVYFASGNEHKRKEVQAILAGHEVRIPRDDGIEFDPVEDGASFLENALIKARALHALTGLPVLADDSGICVDALDGKPGVKSARYGSINGMELDAEERNQLLLLELTGETDRRARFVCAMVLLFGPERFFCAQETLEGEIALEPKGSHGFGYDPIMMIPERGLSVAELPEAEKNAISHRGKALRAVAKFLDLENIQTKF